MDGEAKALRENEDVKEFYLGIAEGKRKSFRDVQALQAPQALAGVNAMRRCTSTILETRDPAARERDLFARLPRADRACDDARPAGRSISPAIDPKSVTQPRGAREAAGAAQIRRCSACRRRRRRSAASTSTPPGKAKRLFMSPGPIFEPEGHGGDSGGAARALFAAGFRAGRRRAQLLLVSPHARRVHARSRRARARLRGDPRRRRQHRAAARRDRATQARRPMSARRISSRSCSMRPRRAGKDASSIKRGARVRRGAAAVAARGARRARRRGASSATRSPRSASSPTRAKAREGMIVNEDMILEIVRPGTGDPVAGRRSRRGRRHHVQSRLSDDPARDRRPVGGAGRARRPAGAPTRASRAGWAAPTRPPR